MKKKFIYDISINSLQLIINQLFGLVIFYILSVYLPKKEFGEINWVLAVLLTSFNVLSFGIDQLIIKKIASGVEAQSALSIYIIHVLLAGGLFYGWLLIAKMLFSSFSQQHYLLLLLGIGKLMIFFSMPFKQLTIGLQKFGLLFYMSICSNVIRGTALILCAVFFTVEIKTIIIIFIAGDIAELFTSLLITRYIVKATVKIEWNTRNYFRLLKESMPLAGVSVFTSAIARFDWIFLGLLASNVVLAEYSFAYEAFEMATLPLLAIAPVLIPRFTKLFSTASNNIDRQDDLLVLLQIEIIIATLVGLIINIAWTPVIDSVTKNQYGAVNQHTILILSSCMPLIYFNNFLWTIHFAKGRFKTIFHVILITFLINIIGDIFLIIYFKAEGAAFAYLLSLIVQFILYLAKTDLERIKKSWYVLLLIPCYAVAGAFIATHLFNNDWLVLITSVLLFIIFLLLSKQIPLVNRSTFRRITAT